MAYALSATCLLLGGAIGVLYERNHWKRRYRDSLPLPEAVEYAGGP